jgi:hypothetical protein
VETPRTPVARPPGGPRGPPGECWSLWIHGPLAMAPDTHTPGGKPTPVPVPAQGGAVDWPTAAPSKAGHVPGDRRPAGLTAAAVRRVSPVRKPAEGFQMGQQDGSKRLDRAGIRPCLSGSLFPPATCTVLRAAVAPPRARWLQPLSPPRGAGVKVVTWLILPVVICLSQRLSHACLSISKLYSETANGSLNQLSFI